MEEETPKSSVYDYLAIPESCGLGKRVFKKLFHENTKLLAADKKAFSEDIDRITWEYTLKPSTIQIQSYEDEEREYPEVAVIDVALKTRRRTARIAEVMHRAIPYPLLLVFRVENCCAFSTAHKRFSQAEKDAIVAENMILTRWIDLNEPAKVQTDFLGSLNIVGLPHTHFYAFYSALADRLLAFECARLTGEYRLESKAVGDQSRRERLAACHELEVAIDDCKTAIKKETQFNRKVELNTELKELQSKLRDMSGML